MHLKIHLPKNAKKASESLLRTFFLAPPLGLPDFTSLHRDKLLAHWSPQKNPIRRSGSGFVLLLPHERDFNQSCTCGTMINPARAGL